LTLIVSASTAVEFAAAANGVPVAVIATAAIKAEPEATARTHRRANMGDSAGQGMQLSHSIRLFTLSNNSHNYHFGNS
jgi:hypothetical protein